MKQERKRKILVLTCMTVFTCFVLFTATYAWFTESDRASMNGLDLSTGGTGELQVEIAVEGGNGRMEMAQVDANNAVIDMGLQDLANIEKNKVGPGAFGEVHFYITSDVTSFNGYTISVTPNYKVVGGNSAEVIKLAKEHIKFYGVKTNSGYSDEVPYRDAGGVMVGLDGKLTMGSEEENETEVILYWYWPYEYQDVPDKTSISAQNTREYDLQDTMIGNYIESIGFTFEVEGNMNEN